MVRGELSSRILAGRHTGAQRNDRTIPRRAMGCYRSRRSPHSHLPNDADLLEAICPLGERQLTRLAEATPEHRFGSLVVEEQRAVGIDDDCRNRKVAGQLPRQDDFEVLLPMSVSTSLRRQIGIRHRG